MLSHYGHAQPQLQEQQQHRVLITILVTIVALAITLLILTLTRANSWGRAKGLLREHRRGDKRGEILGCL